MTQVDELYVRYRELKQDVTKSDADRNRVLLDYLKREYAEEQFHHKVYLAVLILGFTNEEAANQIGCTSFEVKSSLKASIRLTTNWQLEQERVYEDEKTRLQYPDAVEVKGKELRITDIKCLRIEKNCKSFY